MANKKLSQILSLNPVTAAPTGAEPIETVVAGVSEAFTFAQLSNYPLNPQTGTTYTLVITDQGKAVTMSNASANILTIPLNSSVAFLIGAKLLVRQIGAGGTTVVGDGGVTVELDANASLVMSGAQQQILLHKTSTDTWHASAVGGSKQISIATFIQGVLTDSEKVGTFVVATAFTLPASLTDSQAYAEVVPTANAIIDIQVNSVSKGSVDIALGANAATFTFASAVSLVVGDRLQLIGQGTADSTLADVAVTLRGIV